MSYGPLWYPDGKWTGRESSSEALSDSAIVDELPHDLLVMSITASDSTRILGDVGKALAFREPPKSGRNGFFVEPR